MDKARRRGRIDLAVEVLPDVPQRAFSVGPLARPPNCSLIGLGGGVGSSPLGFSIGPLARLPHRTLIGLAEPPVAVAMADGLGIAALAVRSIQRQPGAPRRNAGRRVTFQMPYRCDQPSLSARSAQGAHSVGQQSSTSSSSRSSRNPRRGTRRREREQALKEVQRDSDGGESSGGGAPSPL